ncbi:hypothetical protein DFH06DRAFT_1400061 [Mycena polygramma]|nr:hypothetical protein DFH06DRAFT_1400061 [Mycena polygramma]
MLWDKKSARHLPVAVHQPSSSSGSSNGNGEQHQQPIPVLAPADIQHAISLIQAAYAPSAATDLPQLQSLQSSARDAAHPSSLGLVLPLLAHTDAVEQLVAAHVAHARVDFPPQEGLALQDALGGLRPQMRSNTHLAAEAPPGLEEGLVWSPGGAFWGVREALGDRFYLDSRPTLFTVTMHEQRTAMGKPSCGALRPMLLLAFAPRGGAGGTDFETPWRTVAAVLMKTTAMWRGAQAEDPLTVLRAARLGTIAQLWRPDGEVGTHLATSAIMAPFWLATPLLGVLYRARAKGRSTACDAFSRLLAAGRIDFGAPDGRVEPSDIIIRRASKGLFGTEHRPFVGLGGQVLVGVRSPKTYLDSTIVHF